MLAFVIGGVVAGASGMMLFAPETPGAFALAPPPESEPVVLSPVAVVAADVVEATNAGKPDSLDRCQGISAGCDDAPKADQTPTDGRKAIASAPANAPTPDDGVKPVAAATPAAVSPAASPSAEKSLVEAALPAIFTVPRAIASVAPGLASTISAKTVPVMFLASLPIASAPHQLVSPVLPALAAAPKRVVTTAVALPAPKVAEEVPPAAAPAPAKPRKAARPRNQNRHYANDYYRPSRQNPFSFFFR